MKTDMVCYELDTMCNLRCKHCYNSSGQRYEYIKFSDFKRITDFFLKNENLAILLAGGEPLLHPDIKEILDYLNLPENRHASVVVVTNGVLAKDILVPYLLQEKPFSIQMSLDGATEETNSYIRGKGHFDKVVSFMEFLSQNNYKYGMTRMTINRTNFKEIEAFFELSLSYKFFPTFSFVVRSGNADEYWEELNVPYEERLKCCGLIDSLYVKHEKDFSKITNLESLRKMNLQPSRKCTLLGKNANVRPLIKVNGSVQPCQRLYDDIYSLGNMITEQPEKIFNRENEQLQALINMLENRKLLMRKNLCKECTLREVCEGGCPGRSIDYCGNIMGLDSDCTQKKAYFILENINQLLGINGGKGVSK